MAGITQAKVEAYLEAFRGREVHIKTIIKELGVVEEDTNLLRVLLCGRLREKHLTKPSGKRDGWFKVLKEIKPVRVANVDSNRFFDLTFPMSHTEEHSSFGFEDLIAVSEGDLIVLAGTSNAGKTALALSFIGENVIKYPVVLMGSEYAQTDGTILPKTKRRLEHMKWAQMFNGKGELTFEMLPVAEDYEDYIHPGKINIVDWISLDKDLWLIGNTLERIKKAVGKGLAIVVLQKKRGADFAYGQEATEHYADVYFTIDQLGNWEGRLTVGKVKEPKTKVTGRMWGFEIINQGANLTNIREIERCSTCKGRGYNFDKPCDRCISKGYLDKLDKDDVPF